MEGAFDKRNYLVAFPTELLVYIFSFLLAVRDKINLLYVSKRIRSVAEVPSLWRELVWSYYDSREERYVSTFLSTCGRSIKTLSFPDHVPPLQTLIRYCHNVVELSLPKTELDRVQVGKVIQHMQRLQKLDVEWSFGLMRLLVISNQLEELTIRWRKTVSIGNFRKFKISLNLFLYLLTGRDLKFMPQNINVVGAGLDWFAANELSTVWPNWTVTLPVGHIVHVRVYKRLKTPLDLFPALPEFQFKFGQVANKFGLVKLDELQTACSNSSVICLTDRIVQNTVTLKASFYLDHCDHINCKISSVNFVTDFDLTHCDLLSSDHLELLSIICPNLKRLNLSKGKNCLKSLKGLRAIASCCNNLQGINLCGIQVTEVENHIQLWEILSDMKLTHLALEPCNFMPVEDDDAYRQNLVKLYQKFSHLQALCLGSRLDIKINPPVRCPNCAKLDNHHILLLSKFPSLAYCKLFRISRASTAIQDVLTNCKEIRCFCFIPTFPLVPVSFPLKLTTFNLQQLCIVLPYIDFPDTFMNAVSVHGKLVHVILAANSVSYEGMAALIVNSPELLTFHTVVQKYCLTPGAIADLKKTFSDRRLFNGGSFEVGGIEGVASFTLFGFFDVITDVTSSLFTSNCKFYNDI